jgi:hypothetical protein
MFNIYVDVTIVIEELQRLGLCLVLRASEQVKPHRLIQNYGLYSMFRALHRDP